MNRNGVETNPAQIGRLLAVARQNAEQLAAIDDSGRAVFPLGVFGTAASGAHDASTGIPSSSTAVSGDAADATTRAASASVSIPNYQMVREIHRGGQGVVFQAIRESTGEDVAIKVLHDRRAASPRELERFEREAAVLRELNHPNLIAVSEVGVTSGERGGGRPYLVMPYIPGWPLDEHVRRSGLSVRETLTLFLKVCDAVNVAHLNGVIHRDLKPSNIRVDDEGEPHVLDFGLAKSVISAPLESLTETGQFIGSLPWASPEQADPGLGRVDVRTDVYSLGAVLYQLLTGALPIDPIGSQREVLNRIVTVEPPSPRLLRREINDEVETIVLKCLCKDRARRYSNADGVAADIRRYLAGEAIEAKRDSRWYVLRNALRRHRSAVAAAAGFVLLIAAGLVGTSTLWRQAAHARDAESDQRSRAEAISTFLKEMLTAADPAKAKGEKLTVREALDAAAKKIDDGAMSKQPLVGAEIRCTIGSTYFSLGLYQQAETQFRAADAIQTRELGDQHVETLRTRSRLAEVLSWMTVYAEAVPLAESTLAAQTRTLGAEHPDTQQTMLILGQLLPWADSSRFTEAESLLKSVLEYRERTLGKDHIDTARAMHLLGEAYTVGSAYPEEAEALHREALRIHTLILGPEHPETLETEYLLARALVNLARSAEAEPILRRLLETRGRVQGPDHLGTLGARGMLGAALNSQERYAEAEPLLRESLAALQRTVGPDHHDNVSIRRNLAVCLNGQARHAEAEAVLREALGLSVRCFGPEHAETTIPVMAALAHSLEVQGKDAEAERVARQATDIQRRQKPRPLVWQLSRSIRALIGVLKRRGELDEALTLEQELIGFALVVARAPDASPQNLNDAVRCLLSTEFPVLRDVPQALELATEANRRTDFRNPVFLHTLAQAHVCSGDSTRAKEVWERAFAQLTHERVRSAKLNSAAWWLLSLPPDEPRDARLALEFALQADELSGGTNPAYLDTLALAYHQTGDTARAVESQKKALSLLAADAPDRAEYEDRLREFQAASESAVEKREK